MTDGTRDGQHASKGARIETRHVGPKVRSKWVPDTINLDRLKALLPRLTVDEKRDVLRILDARGKGYPNLDWLASRYERLLNSVPGDAAKDIHDLYGPDGVN